MWSHRRSYPNGGVDRRDGFHKQLDQPEHGSVGYYLKTFLSCFFAVFSPVFRMRRSIRTECDEARMNGL